MTSHEFQIANLVDHPYLVETVAQWHWDEWDHAEPNWSLESTIDGVRGTANRETIPLTLVACADNEPLGSATLLVHDLETRREWSPWVSYVYTRSDVRGQGIGSALVRHVVQSATKLGVTRLYLYTEANGGARRLYERLGWQVIAEEVYKGESVVIMALETRVTERRSSS